MGSMSRLYVRCGDDADLLARVRARHFVAKIEPPSAFASVPFPEGEDVSLAQVEEESAVFSTEVIFLGFMSSTDSLAFTHCINGRCLRHLRYGWDKEDRWWEAVVGEPEVWEHGAFFEDDQLQDIDPGDPERADIEEAFRLGRVRVGTAWPMVDGREAARAAAVHFRLTDWLDDWAEARWLKPVRQVLKPSGSVIAMKPVALAPAPTPAVASVPKTSAVPPPDVPNDVTGRPWWRFW